MGSVQFTFVSIYHIHEESIKVYRRTSSFLYGVWYRMAWKGINCRGANAVLNCNRFTLGSYIPQYKHSTSERSLFHTRSYMCIYVLMLCIFRFQIKIFVRLFREIIRKFIERSHSAFKQLWLPTHILMVLNFAQIFFTLMILFTSIFIGRHFTSIFKITSVALF